MKKRTKTRSSKTRVAPAETPLTAKLKALQLRLIKTSKAGSRRSVTDIMLIGRLINQARALEPSVAGLNFIVFHLNGGEKRDNWKKIPAPGWALMAALVEKCIRNSLSPSKVLLDEALNEYLAAIKEHLPSNEGVTT